MAKKHWSDLSPSTRRIVVAAAIAEGVVKAAALVDLERRPASEVNGSKARWATAIALINSGGLVPLLYFLRGRRAPRGGR